MSGNWRDLEWDYFSISTLNTQRPPMISFITQDIAVWRKIALVCFRLFFKKDCLCLVASRFIKRYVIPANSSKKVFIVLWNGRVLTLKFNTRLIGFIADWANQMFVLFQTSPKFCTFFFSGFAWSFCLPSATFFIDETTLGLVKLGNLKRL